MKNNFYLSAIIFVVAVGLIAAYMFAVQNGYAFSRLIDNDYSVAYLGLVVNEGNAVAGLIVPNGTVTIGSGTAGAEKLNVTGNVNVSGSTTLGDTSTDTTTVNGTISATEMKIGTQNVCRADGTNCPAAPTQTPHGKQRFTSSDTFTVPVGVTTVWVSMSGGGGGGGGDGEGGIGGAGGGGQTYVAEQVSVTSGANIILVVGAGGTFGTSNVSCSNAGGNGVTGGSSSFGSYISALGGGGGNGGSSNGCGNYSGSDGADGTNRGATFGETGKRLQNGIGYGGGGGGSAAGAPGFVLVEW